VSSTIEPLDTRTLLARIKSRLQAVYGDRLRGIVLYGSEARGESTPDSDVDILVLARRPGSSGTGSAYDHRGALPSATGNGSCP
jgi:predicted nucleotidyltransferase